MRRGIGAGHRLFGIRGRQRRTLGSAMVEFTIILPVLLLLVFLILEFGILFGRWLTISNAAREGARVAVVFRSGSCDANTVETEARTAAENYAMSMGVTPVNVTVTGQCVTTFGSLTTVTVTNDYSFFVIDAMLGGLAPSLTLTGTSTMRNEGTG